VAWLDVGGGLYQDEVLGLRAVWSADLFLTLTEP
jgi:hypothetical protein